MEDTEIGFLAELENFFASAEHEIAADLGAIASKIGAAFVDSTGAFAHELYIDVKARIVAQLQSALRQFPNDMVGLADHVWNNFNKDLPGMGVRIESFALRALVTALLAGLQG